MAGCSRLGGSDAIVVEGRFDAPARELLVSLQVRFPSIGSVLITGSRSKYACNLADAVAQAASSIQRQVVRCVIRETAGVRELSCSPSIPLDVDRVIDIGFVKSVIIDASQKGMFIASTEDVLDVPESRMLASAVQGVVLVAESGVTRARDLQDARAVLDTAAANLVGAVFVR